MAHYSMTDFSQSYIVTLTIVPIAKQEINPGPYLTPTTKIFNNSQFCDGNFNQSLLNELKKTRRVIYLTTNLQLIASNKLRLLLLK